MPISTRDMLALATGNGLPVVRDVTPNLSVFNPLYVESGLIDPRTGRKIGGIPLGYCGPKRSGGLFWFDPNEMYRAGVVQDLNWMVFGITGYRKSSMIKHMIFRGVRDPFNYRFCVVDRKENEYAPIAAAIEGSRTLRFGEGTNHFINPLDRVMDFDTQKNLLKALLVVAIGENQDLGIEQSRLLSEALRAVHAEITHRPIVLQDLSDKLREPTPEMALKLDSTVEQIKQQGRKMFLGLSELIDGDYRGMFHEPTTPGMFDAVPLLVLDCSNVEDEKAVLMSILINFFTMSMNKSVDASRRFNFVPHDEAWGMAKHGVYVDSLRTSFKIGRTLGISVGVVTHHFSNLIRSGGKEAVKDLMSDSSTMIIFRQDPGELESLAPLMDLSDREAELATTLEPGFAIFKVRGKQGIEIEIVAWDEELPLIRTSQKIEQSHYDS